jgi:hypothetical protein
MAFKLENIAPEKLSRTVKRLKVIFPEYEAVSSGIPLMELIAKL